VANRLSEEEYWALIETLANRVCDEAHKEGWLEYQADGPDATPLQGAVNELARSLRQVHYPGDGCVDEE
jgi:hypothetical protein